MFLGEHQHNLDAKGRVTLPARFRELLTDDGDARFVRCSAATPCSPGARTDASRCTDDRSGK